MITARHSQGHTGDTGGYRVRTVHKDIQQGHGRTRARMSDIVTVSLTRYIF